MSKFNTRAAQPVGCSPIAGEQSPSGMTFEGGAGYVRDTRSELFLLAVTNMAGEDTFYESAGQRDSRFTHLVHAAATADPEWTAAFLRWLRSEANMRSASLVGAAEYVKARLDTIPQNGTGAQAHAAYTSDFTPNRKVIASVLQRADEPGEMLAYWTGRYGRAIPKPMKRGIADAVTRLYTEYALAKYDAAGKGYRFGDVLNLVHPEPSAAWQADLFAHALDRRYGRDSSIPDSLSLLRARTELMALPVEQRRGVVEDTPERLRAAGMTWEALAGWLQGPMDAAAWQAMIPSMGYMALLRNLRNFDEAGVSAETAAAVAARLGDQDQVARSRQLPMRFLSAYKAAPSLRWAWPLEQAMTASLNNVPALSGRTLVLVDTSTSMQEGFSKDGTLARWDAAAVFGIALASQCANAELVSFSSAQRYYSDPPGTKTLRFPLQAGESLLRAVQRWGEGGYFLGGGTDTPGAVRKHYSGHGRVVILTDEQAATGPDIGSLIPARVPLYTWNLAGYQFGHAPSGSANRHTFGGLTDAAFRMIPFLEAGRDGAWPWVTAA